VILGMSISEFTTFHAILSLIGIAAGFVVMFGLLASTKLEGWTALFLGTTVLTSVTGLFFPRAEILPSHIVGVISLVAIVALYVYRLTGACRWIYVLSAMVSLYLNVFVGVVQAFIKVPFINALAPTQKEPPVLIAQVAVLAIFVVLGIVAVRSFHPGNSASGLSPA
jgi:hypothetical protein